MRQKWYWYFMALVMLREISAEDEVDDVTGTLRRRWGRWRHGNSPPKIRSMAAWRSPLVAVSAWRATFSSVMPISRICATWLYNRPYRGQHCVVKDYDFNVVTLLIHVQKAGISNTAPNWDKQQLRIWSFFSNICTLFILLLAVLCYINLLHNHTYKIVLYIIIVLYLCILIEYFPPCG